MTMNESFRRPVSAQERDGGFSILYLFFPHFTAFFSIRLDQMPLLFRSAALLPVEWIFFALLSTDRRRLIPLSPKIRARASLLFFPFLRAWYRQKSFAPLPSCPLFPHLARSTVFRRRAPVSARGKAVRTGVRVDFSCAARPLPPFVLCLLPPPRTPDLFDPRFAACQKNARRKPAPKKTHRCRLPERPRVKERIKNKIRPPHCLRRAR